MIKKLMMLCFATMAATGAWAATNMPPVSAEGSEPKVTDVVAKQRYPWNGLVDITCNVSGIVGTTNELRLALAAVMPETGNARSVRNFWVVRGGSNSTDCVVTTNGNYRLLWDAAADLGTVDYSNMVVRVSFDAHDKVQLWEGGPYWATTNIGAEKPEDYGYHFWWGDTVGYKRENDKWVASDGSNSNFSFDSNNTATYNKSISTLQSQGWIVTKDGTYILAPEHDAAQVQWGGEWRMPTHKELYDLCYNKCDWTWSSVNGVNGYIVRGRGDYASNSIFLPCAGLGYGTSLSDSGSYGHYWSSGPGSGNYNAYEMNFYSSHHDTYFNYFFDRYRYLGFSVRPVQGFTK